MRRSAQFAIQIFPALLFAVFFLGLTNSPAQSLGDLARQERERVRNNATKPTHVFTNEDLARFKILAGLEQENSDAHVPVALDPAVRATVPASGSEQPVKELVAPVWPQGTPLGDVARYYRRLRELRSEPLESPLVAQDTSQGTTPVQSSNAPRQDASALSPDQPLQQPKKIIAVSQPAVRGSVPAPRVIRVSPGDSLWKIAGRYLGDGNQWREIARANPEIADPNLIQVGQQIRLPGESDAVAAAGNQVRVQAGDSLWKLAQAQWGNGQAWSCIAESNPQIQDSSKIYPGQTLALPATCSLRI